MCRMFRPKSRNIQKICGNKNIWPKLTELSFCQIKNCRRNAFSWLNNLLANTILVAFTIVTVGDTYNDTEKKPTQFNRVNTTYQKGVPPLVQSNKQHRIFYVELHWYFSCVSLSVPRIILIAKAAKIELANKLFSRLKAFCQRFRNACTALPIL